MNPLWLLAIGVAAVGVVLFLARRRETKAVKAQDTAGSVKQ
jgi:hypothetical protein